MEQTNSTPWFHWRQVAKFEFLLDKLLKNGALQHRHTHASRPDDITIDEQKHECSSMFITHIILNGN
jgi:hypothetical protein